MDLIVPDSIEPVVGWKALHIDPQGYLHSPQQTFRWNPRQRVEATCFQLSYGWTARPGGPISERAPFPHRLLPAGGFTSTATIINPTQHGLTWDVPDDVAPPQTVLPEGMHWSWEPTVHSPAHNGCGCGIYMVDDPTGTVPYLDDLTVLVQVSGWGNVVQGDKGNRVQYAYPRLIITPGHLHEWAELAADLYKVPLQLWKPGMNIPDINLSRTVTPTLNTAKAVAALNQMAQAQAKMQAQFQQVSKTLKTVAPEPERSEPSVFMALSGLGLFATLVFSIAGVASGNSTIKLAALGSIIITVLLLFADFLVFNAREKAAGR